MVVYKVAVFFALFVAVTGATAASSVSSLNFLIMVINGSESEVLPAVDQALDEINNDPAILPNHRLEYTSRSTRCDRTTALENFFNATNGDDSLVAVVGCGCSPATEEVAKISHFKNLPVISYASTSVVLSDRSVYQSFFRTIPSDNSLVSGLATILDTYEWSQVSVFTEEQPQYLQLTRLLQLDSRINISSRIAVHWNELLNYTQFADSVLHILNAQPHIYILAASYRTETFVLCSAYHNQQFYPNYALVFLGYHENDWWRQYYMQTNCSEADIMRVLNRSLVLLPYLDNSSSQVEQDGLYNVSSYVSDAVRSLARALNSCLMNEEVSSTSCVETQLDWNITFTGNTGLVRFDRNGNRQASSNVLLQYRMKDNATITQPIGIVMDRLDLFGNASESDIWPDGIPPDGTPVVVVHTLSVEITVVHFLLAGIVLTSVIICWGFQIIFRKKKVVKLISPNLNYLLLLGVLFMAISTLAYPSTEFALVAIGCTTDRFFASLGYDIVIGIALVKTFRVYYIFKNPSPTKRLLKDWKLMIIVLVITLIEISFAIPLLAVALVNGDIAMSPSMEREPVENEQGVIQNFYSINCGLTMFFEIFVGVAIGYKLILHGIGVVLACLIRKVKVDILNDSRETVAIIYCSTVLLVVATLVVLALNSSPNLANIAWAVIVFLASLTHLGLTYVPKMLALYKDPRGEKVFSKVNRSTIHSSGSNLDNGVNSDNKVVSRQLTTLRNKVSQLEKQLKVNEEDFQPPHN